MSTRWILAGCLVILPCCRTPEQPSTPVGLEDGFYAVAEGVGNAGEAGSGVRSIPRVPDEEGAPATELGVFEAAVVPLRLRSEPEWVVGEDQRPRILLSLSEECAESLAEYSREHVGGQVAVVIDGEAVSVHKVREPIVLPELAISACGEGILERLWEALQVREPR